VRHLKANAQRLGTRNRRARRTPAGAINAERRASGATTELGPIHGRRGGWCRSPGSWTPPGSTTAGGAEHPLLPRQRRHDRAHRVARNSCCRPRPGGTCDFRTFEGQATTSCQQRGIHRRR
jgi:hypothetical protein